MEIKIPSKLYQLYLASHKNIDMSIMTLLDSFDPDVFLQVFSSIKPISAKEGNDVNNVKIGDAALAQIIDSFGNHEVCEDLVNSLLWIAILFPEI